MMQKLDSHTEDLFLYSHTSLSPISKAKPKYLQRGLSIQMLHFLDRNELQAT